MSICVYLCYSVSAVAHKGKQSLDFMYGKGNKSYQLSKFKYNVSWQSHNVIQFIITQLSRIASRTW